MEPYIVLFITNIWKGCTNTRLFYVNQNITSKTEGQVFLKKLISLTTKRIGNGFDLSTAIFVRFMFF